MTDMEYIYIDYEGRKCVNRISGLTITPFFDFEIEINGNWIWCQMDHALTEWCIHFINIDKNVELSYPTDIIWNTEALYEAFEDVDVSRKIAYAIKTIFQKAAKR